MTLSTPRLLGGRYALGPVLGVGGMADVYLGTDTRLGREVAVKVLRVDLARDPGVQHQFRREAQSAASLNAPCIVSVYDTGSDPVGDSTSVPWIVMERVHGRTLRDLLREEGPLLPQRGLEVVAAVCAALEIAHGAGIVHRDIKPGNVMLTPLGEVKVMDFGIARAAADSAATMTQTSDVVGTAAYLSPEQARGEHVDARSDLYSTGCLLYELLTGHPPFRGDSPVAVAYQHVREEPRLPSSLDPALGPEVDAVVVQAMAKDPARRYQTAAQMRADLLRAAAGERVEAAPVVAVEAPVPGSVLLVPAAPRWSGLLHVALALLLVAVVAGVALAVRTIRTRDAQVVAVPSVVELGQRDAQARLADDGLVLGQVRPRFADRPAGTVLEQTPAPGERSRTGQPVSLVVSQGVERTLVPAVLGVQRAEAEAVLRQSLLAVQVVERSGNSAPGTVLEVLPPPGTALPTGSAVTVVVASGTVDVPPVVGLPLSIAAQNLQAAGFNVGVRFRTDPGPAGIVVFQDPAGAGAARGSTVTITVSAAAPAAPPPRAAAPRTPAPSSAAPSPAPTPPVASPTPTAPSTTPAPPLPQP